MQLDEIRRRLVAISARAERQFPRRTARHIQTRIEILLDVIDPMRPQVSCAGLLMTIRVMRTEEDWPGPLPAWAWFDSRLFALADQLCSPDEMEPEPMSHCYRMPTNHRLD